MSDVGEVTEVERGESGITITFRGQNGYVTGWPQSREDLGLNVGGPDPVGGVEVLDEEETDDGLGYTQATLRFDSGEALERASNRLYDQATERFEYGMGRDAEKVQTFAGRIPLPPLDETDG